MIAVRYIGLRNAARWILGAGISLALLYLSVRGVDWPTTWQTLAHADPALLATALFSVLFTTWLKAVRWRLMFYPHHRRLRVSSFLIVFLIGQMINAIIPARLGEVARAFLIGEREGVSKAHALWTAVVEKVLDAFTLLAFLAALALWVPLPPWLQQARWTLTGGVAFVIVALIGAALYRPRFLLWLESYTARHRWLRRLRVFTLARAVLDSLRLMRRPALSGGLLLWSILAFLAAACTNWLTGQALGLDLSGAAALLLLAVLQISAVVPIPTSPGRVGLFHYLCILSLAIFGVPRDTALSYGLVLHALTYLPMAIGGPLGLWLQSYRWRDISHWLNKEESLPPDASLPLGS